MKDSPARREELETILTNGLQKNYPGPLTRALLSEGGKFAFLYVDGKCVAQRRLSQKGKDFLRGASITLLPGDSFLESEWPNRQ